MGDEHKYDSLKLENQLCFPLYAASKEIVRRYKPFLDKLDMTYTQYIAMMVLWDRKQVTVKELGNALFLDSGTLTPMLKKMEKKGWVTRARSDQDERTVIIRLTELGAALEDQALDVPKEMAGCVKLAPEDAKTLYSLLYRLLDGMET